jgi:hypothetical protein
MNKNNYDEGNEIDHLRGEAQDKAISTEFDWEREAYLQRLDRLDDEERKAEKLAGY